VSESRPTPSISQVFSGFAQDFEFEAIPEAVRTRALHLILDAVGIAHAASSYEFAHRALTALQAFGGGDSDVIGMPARLSLRDAALMNGILVHGIDFDDTYLPGGIHATASCFPCALGMAAHLGLSGRDVITAYVLGMEIATRLSAVAKGELHQVGFHPTGLIAAFGCAVMTGRLIGMTADQITMAQGITSSTASGSSREYSEETAWNKRVHPGWAAVSGITAAMLARQGFTGPTRVYEGKYGLFPSHAADRIGRCDYSLATEDLGAKWEIERVAVKPVPVGQLGIALVDAAVALSREHRIAPADVASMLVLIPKEAVPIMWEPIAKRRRPANGYAAQFSIPYTVAASFARSRFGLAELSASSIADPEILALADRIEYAIDPDSPYPKYYSGELIVTTRDGRKLRHREHVNRGAEDRPVSNDDIVEKFMGNMQTVASAAHAERIRKLILGLDADIAAGEVGRALAQPH